MPAKYPRNPSMNPDADRELARQDAARAKARLAFDQKAGYNPQVRAATFRDSFAKSIKYEFDLAGKWGASADTVQTPYGDEVTVSIKRKYPPRVIGAFEKWLVKHCRFQFPPCKNLKGCIFNEGGRGVTLTMTAMVPFRLYIAGRVLNRTQTGVWTLQSRTAWENGILKKLGWVRK
jgi:hypothetical protein